MKSRCAFLRMATVLTAALCVSSQAASVAFQWRENSETDLAGYKLYYGPASRAYTNHVVLGQVGTYRMSNLVDGATYYFALAAFNANNVESALSTELHYPNAPVLAPIANQTVAEDQLATLAVNVIDVDSPIANVTLSATSGNLVLVPNSAISFLGSGTNRSMEIRPAANRTGTATITVTASDGSLSSTGSLVLTVSAVADAPSIAVTNNVSTDEDVETTITFNVSDPESSASNLTVRAVSDNPLLIPTNRIVFGGTAADRTLRLRPAVNQHGSARITLTVSDGTLSTSTNLIFTVQAINDPPVIGAINDRTVPEDTQIGPLTFTINDAETAPGSLQVTASSSNPVLLPQENIVLNGGTGTNRTLTVRPVTNAFGSGVITITVSDGELSASEPLTINYQSVNDAPFVSQPPNLVINKFIPVPPVPFTVWDVETAASALTITFSSTNTTLLPLANISLSGAGTNRTLSLTPSGVGTTRVGIHVNDGTVTSRVFFVFTVTGSNNPPVLTVPGALAANAGASVPVRGIAVADPDVKTNNLDFTISAASGTLTLATSVAGGVKASQVSGNNSGAISIVAPLAALNATLSDPNGLTYTSRQDFEGTEILVLSVDDNGFSGAGGVRSDTKSITIQVTRNRLEAWRAGYFTAADLQDPAKEATVWGDLADPDSDGRHNLMEFALGLNPLGSEPQEFALVSQTTVIGGNQYHTLTFNARINEPLLQYIPEVSADNVTWSATAQRTAATPINAEFEQVTYQDSVPITPETARFIRLRVVRNSP